jgi:hypothetical protein
MKVEMQLLHQSQPIIYTDVRNTYTNTQLFIYLE